MFDPLFWTRCPGRYQVDDYPAYWSCRCENLTHDDGMIPWPQDCPECDGEGTYSPDCTGCYEAGFCVHEDEPCPAGCDNGRIWPQGWRVVEASDKCGVFPNKTLAVPLEEP